MRQIDQVDRSAQRFRQVGDQYRLGSRSKRRHAGDREVDVAIRPCLYRRQGTEKDGQFDARAGGGTVFRAAMR